MTDAPRPLDDDAVPWARVVSAHRGAFRVRLDGAEAWAELPGTTYHRAADRRDHPVVGDWVALEGWTGAVEAVNAATIRAVRPRRTLLVRKAAGERSDPQPIVANIDLALVVTSANLDVSPRRLERYLELILQPGIRPLVIVNKLDLDPSGQAQAAIARRLPTVPCLSVSALRGDGLDALRARLAGQTSVLLGSSGVGKSSLLNALVGDLAQEVQGIRGHDDRGRHTTTARRLFDLADGGALIDTPGMREVGLWRDDDDADAARQDDAALDHARALAQTCRFSDCQHAQEPGCAVREAVARGELDEDQRQHLRTRQQEGARNAQGHARGQRQRATAAARQKKLARDTPTLQPDDATTPTTDPADPDR